MRLSKDEYYMRIAEAAAGRSTCLDKQVGCVLVDELGRVIATGFNGAPRGMDHCCDLGRCRVEMSNGDKLMCPAAHAEQNALLYADPMQVYKCYCTLEPCVACTRMLMNTTCAEVIFKIKTSNHGKELWEEVNDSATWRHVS